MNDIFNTVISILASTIRMSIPLILVSLGGVFSARAGIVAMGLEGMMLTGAFFAALITYITGNPYIGLVAGMAAGSCISYILGVLIVKFNIDQVIGGIGINIFAQGFTTLLMVIIWGNRGKSPNLPQIKNMNIPLIGKISPLLIFAIIFVIISWFVIYKTKFGLHLRMTGENPKAAVSVGINVKKIKYISVIITGALAGLGGSYFSINNMDIFARNMTSGRGFIALSIDILGRYNPFGVMFGSFLFGLAEALQISLQKYNVPGQLLQMIPYVVTLFIIIFGVKYVKPPASMGKNIED